MPAKGAGRTSRNFRRLSANLKAQRRPCCRCGQAIDYSITDHLHPDAFTVEHIQPRSLHPELAEDPANLDAAHRRCNSSRGNGPGTPTLGMTSRDW